MMFKGKEPKKKLPIRITRVRVGHNAGLFKAHAYGMTWFGKSKQEIIAKIPTEKSNTMSYGTVRVQFEEPPF